MNAFVFCACFIRACVFVGLRSCARVCFVCARMYVRIFCGCFVFSHHEFPYCDVLFSRHRRRGVRCLNIVLNFLVVRDQSVFLLPNNLNKREGFLQTLSVEGRKPQRAVATYKEARFIFFIIIFISQSSKISYLHVARQMRQCQCAAWMLGARPDRH